MNQTIKHTLSALVISAVLTSAHAETAYTNPVMAASNQIAGNGGSGVGFSVIGFPALNPVDATGTISSIASVSGEMTTLNVANTPDTWATNDFASQGGFAQFNFRDVPLYYIEITDVTDDVAGPLDGQILDIVATATGSPNTLTVGADLTGMDSELAGTTFEVRKKHTIAGVFGATNEAGFLAGQNDTASDLIYNLYLGSFETVYYQDDQTGVFGDGWRLPSDPFTDVGDICIDPDFGLIIAKRDNNPIDIVSVGDVKLGTARTQITQGFNPVIFKFPVSATLGTSGLYVDGDTVLQSGQNDTTADLVYILTNGSFVIYYYQDDQTGVFGDGWRTPSDPFTDKADEVIASGSPVIVFRRGATPVEWTKAQPFSLN